MLERLSGEDTLAYWINAIEDAYKFSQELQQDFTTWIRDGISSAYDYFSDSANPFFPGGPTLRNMANPSEDDDDNYRVNFKMVLDNQTNDDLKLHQIQVIHGWVKKAIVTAKANENHSMHGRHLSETATGCVGTCAWAIGETRKILAVMYSVPYDHKLYR